MRSSSAVADFCQQRILSPLPAPLNWTQSVGIPVQNFQSREGGIRLSRLQGTLPSRGLSSASTIHSKAAVRRLLDTMMNQGKSDSHVFSAHMQHIDKKIAIPSSHPFPSVVSSKRCTRPALTLRCSPHYFHARHSCIHLYIAPQHVQCIGCSPTPLPTAARYRRGILPIRTVCFCTLVLPPGRCAACATVSHTCSHLRSIAHLCTLPVVVTRLVQQHTVWVKSIG